MARFIMLLFLAVVILNAELIMSSNQHMICKPVNEIFSNDEHLPRQSRVYQGPSGKRGVSGVKGQPGVPGLKGDRGFPGYVNDTAIEMSIESRVNSEVSDINSIISSLQTSAQTRESENRKMREDIQTLNKTVNKKVSDMNSIISSLQTSIQTMQSENSRMKEDIRTLNQLTKCEDGDIYYGGYCFWFDVTYRTFAASESKCKSRHSTAGHIMNRNHYDLIMEKIREQIPASGKGFWLGLRQDPSSGSVTIISNGLEASFLMWQSGAPDRRSSETNVYLRVDKDASSVYNGMGDASPTASLGVICQYKSL